MLVRTSPKRIHAWTSQQYKAETEEETYSQFQDNFELQVHMNVIRNNEIYWFFKNLEGKME
jgi:hypothetical protein